MGEFPDHFSACSTEYAEHRPGYPETLFDWLADLCPSRELAWDAGTGSGQAARGLAGRFARVVATDASAAQVAAAPAIARVEFRVEDAESPSLPSRSVDLVTSAQAAHWFDLTRFHQAVERVARPGSVVALWCYGPCLLEAALAPLLEECRRLVEAHWPPQRAFVESGYRSLPFPYRKIPPPPFEMRSLWKADQFLAYVDTWSATRRGREAEGRDPLRDWRGRLAEAWGPGGREVRWPLALLAGRVGDGRAATG